MKLIALMLIISTLLLLTSGRLAPQRKFHVRPRPGPKRLPEDIREPGQTIHPDLDIPNPKFCEKMALQPAMHYMVLPWWYNYCARMKENEEEKYRSAGMQNLHVYRNILNFVNSMKKYVKIIISLHITKALSKRKYASSSEEESIENLLYYKDCQHRRSQTTTSSPAQQLKMPEPVRENPCPFPRMCCSMSCDDTCNSGVGMGMGNGMGSMMQRQQDVMQPFMSSMNPAPPRQPHLFSPGMKPRGRKKTLQPTDLLPPIEARRDSGFTKEKIKSLISEDGDIRKILKDLVRVTMQKVDLLDMMNGRRSNGEGGGENEEREQLYKNDDELE